MSSYEEEVGEGREHVSGIDRQRATHPARTAAMFLLNGTPSPPNLMHHQPHV